MMVSRQSVDDMIDVGMMLMIDVSSPSSSLYPCSSTKTRTRMSATSSKSSLSLATTTALHCGLFDEEEPDGTGGDQLSCDISSAILCIDASQFHKSMLRAFDRLPKRATPERKDFSRYSP